MWSKLYLGLLGLATAVITFFTYYSWSWLQSIGAPAVALAGYDYHTSLSWPILWVSTAVLLLVGNAVLWDSQRAWALWTTFAYFATLVVVRYFWLDRAVSDFRSRIENADSVSSLAPFYAVVLIVFMSAVVFVDQFIIIRLRARTYRIADAATDHKPSE